MDRYRKLLLPVVLLGLIACEEDTSDVVISQFEGPQDVALVCYDESANKPLPLDCCGNEVSLGNTQCPFGISTANLYAFVTQHTPGEVAVVNVDDHEIVDQERQIPYNSFIPVGGQPNDIAATTDGTKVYTANYLTDDVSVIRVVDEGGFSVINSPSLSPANSIDLGSAAARIALVKHPARHEDRVALVTQPKLGRVAVLALRPDECPAPDVQEDGCVKGYLTLSVPDDTEEGSTLLTPYAISSADGQSVYVGSYDSSVIVDIQLESLVEEALALEEPGEIDPKKVVNEYIDISPYQLRAISVEPVKRRWIYGIDNVRGNVIALDLGGRVPGSEKPVKMTEVSVPGLPRAVKILELDEEDEPGPFTFNGTFAVIATSLAGIAVADIEDNDPKIDYFHPHRIRSLVDLRDEEVGVPKVDDFPSFEVDGERVDDRQIGDYLTFVEDDAGVECDPDAGVGFRPEFDRGVQFRCDPYESRQQRWTIAWEGPIGLNGTGVIVNIDDKNAKSWLMVNQDAAKDFCGSELYTPNTFPGYPGDRLIISNTMIDDDSQDLCEKTYEGKENQLAYQIVGVSRYGEGGDDANDNGWPNAIEFKKIGGYSVDLLPECFGKSVQFEVRASDHWTIRGSRSEYSPRQGKFVPEDNACVYEETDPSELRVFEGEKYKNQYISFRMAYGDEWTEGPTKIDPDDEDTDPSLEANYAFEVVNGYEEMYRVINATDISDIELSPDEKVILIDNGGEGLIVFDLKGSFNISGANVN